MGGSVSGRKFRALSGFRFAPQVLSISKCYFLFGWPARIIVAMRDRPSVVRFYSCRLTICLDWITWPPHTLLETSCKKSEIPWSLVEVQEPSWFYEYLLILCLIGVLWIIFYQNSHWGNLYVGASAICNEEFLQEDKESQNVSEHECGRTSWNPTLLRCWSDL